jgi:hypothetical protein
MNHGVDAEDEIERSRTLPPAEPIGLAQNPIAKWVAAAHVLIYVNPVSGYRLFNRTDRFKLVKKAAQQSKLNSELS